MRAEIFFRPQTLTPKLASMTELQAHIKPQPADAELNTGVAWFCLRSQPKHEHIAAGHLRQIEGVEVFNPRIRFTRPTRVGPIPDPTHAPAATAVDDVTNGYVP